jgi:hypothetical protein
MGAVSIELDMMKDVRADTADDPAQQPTESEH